MNMVFQMEGETTSLSKNHIIRKKAGRDCLIKGRFIDMRLNGGVSLNRLKSF